MRRTEEAYIEASCADSFAASLGRSCSGWGKKESVRGLDHIGVGQVAADCQDAASN